ncbi:Auracyanin-B precursor [Pirellula sp. SH-Sr6A]|uniref:plastocyanin/azurin family copper-binding protein n=1 Tax=Pirellula sp. SH-Sr6A TaxID=1632865 RepID=UPI00078ED50B|nr:plastocyanin/azurin family copper-binding protein [Pirellula sp. SH-Sr6A]AMV32024.1 Auracyanin-B precursor [Pirellula sp. SH-Sr6A]
MHAQEQPSCCPLRSTQWIRDEIRWLAFRRLCWLSIVFAFAEGILQPTAKGWQSDEQIPEPAERARITRNWMERAHVQGDTLRGAAIFASAKVACASCHALGEVGGKLGPELLSVAKKRTPEQLVESVLWPNLTIEPEYVPYKYLLEDDRVVSGYRTNSEEDAILLIRDPAKNEIISFAKDEIVQSGPSRSLMPHGLLDALPQDKRVDLIRFVIALRDLNDSERLAAQRAIQSATHHALSTFTWNREPLRRDAHPYADHLVNRDRVYDFYAKQANAFRNLDTGLDLLQAYPGLDGGTYGHWGNQNEETWRGNEWESIRKHRLQATVFFHPSRTLARAVCFRLGHTDAWSVCYDPDSMGFVSCWQNGFLRFSSVRHGFMDGARMEGEERELPPKSGPLREVLQLSDRSNVRYLGYRYRGDQVQFLLLVDGEEYIDEMQIVKGELQRKLRKERHANTSDFKPPNRRWPESVETTVQNGLGEGYVVDTISLPFENPWGIPLFIADHAFLSDGSALLCTMHGDVLRAEGFTSTNPTLPNADTLPNASTVRWTRVASGLHHPLGMWIDSEGIFVLGRNQITRLHDENADGEFDRYECFSHAYITSPNGHDYICGLVRDREGNFYTVSGNQGLVRIAPNGQSADVIATGFRNPDGLGILPDGSLTVPCSEGDWTPASMIHLVPAIEKTSALPRSPRFFGYRGPQPGKTVEKPLLYLPRGVDNSSGGQLWVDSPRMGPLDQHLLHTSYGTGTAWMILSDRVSGFDQSAAVRLPGEYRSGVHRAKVHPADGSVYLSGMSGWGTYTPDAGCFERLRYTGRPVQMPIGFHVRQNGIEIRFSEPIDREKASDPVHHFVQGWNYRYSPGYGSPELSISQPRSVGHDRLRIESVVVSDDGREIFLELPELQKCSQLYWNYAVGGEDALEMFATVHAMDAPRMDVSSGARMSSKEWLPHPLERDIEWLQRSIPNPWGKQRKDSSPILIAASDNLQFAQRSLQAKPGEWLQLTFKNPDVVPHNWVLLRPNSLDRVGALANQVVSDPDAYLYHYVPKSPDVLCYTDIVEPKSEFTITFQAPMEPGRYPYLCTFPGHWMVMNGELIIAP